MKPATVCALVCGLLAAHAVRADVTMRSKIDYKLGSYLPPAAAEGMNKSMGEMLANGVLLRIKGKRSVTSSGPLLVITDQDKGTITLLDPKGKRYATCPIAEYGDQLKAAMPEMPPQAKQMLESLKIDVKTDKTGKTDVIKGLKTEEMLVTVTMSMDGPMAAMMGMKMEMHMWAATKEELERVPALKEIAAYMRAQATGTDPASMASKMFGQLPGLGDKLKGPMEEMLKASSNAVLRMQMKMMMPGSAKMMGAKDPDEPFTDMTTDLVELSTDAIADAIFQVPEGYQSAKLEELVKLLSPVRQGPQQ
jgi:hypothetical protein